MNTRGDSDKVHVQSTTPVRLVFLWPKLHCNSDREFIHSWAHISPYPARSFVIHRSARHLCSSTKLIIAFFRLTSRRVHSEYIRLIRRVIHRPPFPPRRYQTTFIVEARSKPEDQTWHIREDTKLWRFVVTRLVLSTRFPDDGEIKTRLDLVNIIPVSLQLAGRL